MNRRTFLKLTGIAALSPSLPAAAASVDRSGPRLVLSGDGNGHTTYSVRPTKSEVS